MPNANLPAHLLLWGALLATAWSAVSAWRWWRGRERSRRGAALGAVAALGLLGWAFLVLLSAFVRSDFRYVEVVNYSSLDLALLYKVSAVWAGQAGSLLLWAVMVAALALVPLRLRPRPAPLALSIFQATQVGFLGILIRNTPFGASAPVPPDGHGLNPLLQDPWMATHPPVLFLGYAAAALPFALALAALWRGEKQAWVPAALRWNLVTVLTLGAGILLGAFWAYEVLGWGGYWGWDPVENASLIPWLTAAALLHGLLVQRRTGALVRTNLLLASGTYLFVLYSTFLTRSGVLSSVSVHSFPQGGIFWPLVAFMLILLGVGTAFSARRWGALAGKPLSWTLDLGTVLSVTLGLLLVSAGIILGGTTWPILSSFYGEPASPKPAFYNQANLPVYVLVAALLVAAPLLGWKAIPLRRLLRVSIVPVAAGLATAAWAMLADIEQPLFLALMLFSGAAVGSCMVRAARALRTSPMKVGAPLAHVGMALVFVGVLVSSVGESREQVRVGLGETAPALSRQLLFDGAAGSNFRLIVDPEGAAIPATLRLVQTDGGQTQRKPDIVRTWKGDLYLSPVGVERGSRLGRRLALERGKVFDLEGTPVMFERFAMESHEEGMVVAAVLRLADGSAVVPKLRMAAGGQQAEPVELPGSGVGIALVGMQVEAGRVFLDVAPPGAPELLYVEASWKPGMNLLWGGSILLCLGTALAVTRRLLHARREALQERDAAGVEIRQGKRAPRRAAARVRRAAGGKA